MTRSELADGITDREVRSAVGSLMDIAIRAAAIGEAISQPLDVDVDEFVIRPTAQGWSGRKPKNTLTSLNPKVLFGICRSVTRGRSGLSPIRSAST
jgi:hypothetical protein